MSSTDTHLANDSGDAKSLTDLIVGDVTSTGRVATDRPARYGKQLVSHFSRKVPAEWDDAAASGTVTFGDGVATLTCEPGTLVMAVSAPPDAVERLEDVMARHLVKFGARDELTVVWERSVR